VSEATLYGPVLDLIHALGKSSVGPAPSQIVVISIAFALLVLPHALQRLLMLALRFTWPSPLPGEAKHCELLVACVDESEKFGLVVKIPVFSLP
jgi:hypothetical protein